MPWLPPVTTAMRCSGVGTSAVVTMESPWSGLPFVQGGRAPLVQDGPMSALLPRMRSRQEWALFSALYRAAPRHAVGWWTGLVLRGVLPAAIAVASGWLIAAITDGTSLTPPLVV